MLALGGCGGGGPGVGKGGQPGKPCENCNALGNILILSEDGDADTGVRDQFDSDLCRHQGHRADAQPRKHDRD